MAVRVTEERPVQPSGEPGRKPNLLDDVRSLWLELRGLTHDHLKLATLEAKRAGRSLVSMIIAGLIMAVLLISAWFGLMGAATLALIESNMVGDIESILLVVAVNLVVALLLFWYIRRKSHYLLFPETVHSLRDKEEGS